MELPFYTESEDIRDIHARTVKQDGTVVDFDGKIFDKSLAKGRRIGLRAKTFTLPDVQVGSIIEYFYTVDWKHLYDSHWILTSELFTRNAKFSLKPYKSANVPTMRWSWHSLPPGAEAKEGPDGIVRMEASNIDGFKPEDFMPTANELKARVDFIYELEMPDKDLAKFWQRIGKSWNGKLESFIDKRKVMEQAVAEIVSPNDSQEAKLRKIYDRVQAIRNKSYEVRKTEQEEKRNKEKAEENVEDVWKRGYGNKAQLTWLYLALVRAAGFEAYGCWVSNRREYFFTPNTMESSKLNANVVLVKLNGKDLYFDPGAEFTPFGMLTWSETGVRGLRLDKDGGSWIETSLPKASESRVERDAKLKLSDNGDLEGKLTVTYTGLEAMYHRLSFRNEDEIARKKFLEDAVRAQIPVAAEAELTNKPDWSSSETPLVAEFDLKVPGWASSAGKGEILPTALFTANEKRLFQHATRVYPIYFNYPLEKREDVTIELPAGWQATNLPAPQSKDSPLVAYDLKVESAKEGLRLKRKLAINILLLEPKYYTALRNFFEGVRTGDEEQILLQPAAASAGN